MHLPMCKIFIIKIVSEYKNEQYQTTMRVLSKYICHYLMKLAMLHYAGNTLQVETSLNYTSSVEITCTQSFIFPFGKTIIFI